MNKTFKLISGVIAIAVVIVSIAIAQQGQMKHDTMDMRSKVAKKAAVTIEKEKAKTVKMGHYNCCLKHSCDFYAMKMGSCTCGMNAASDKPVCNERKGGWAASDGAVPGKSADDIKTMPRGMMGMGK